MRVPRSDPTPLFERGGDVQGLNLRSHPGLGQGDAKWRPDRSKRIDDLHVVGEPSALNGSGERREDGVPEQVAHLAFEVHDGEVREGTPKQLQNEGERQEGLAFRSPRAARRAIPQIPGREAQTSRSGHRVAAPDRVAFSRSLQPNRCSNARRRI